MALRPLVLGAAGSACPRSGEPPIRPQAVREWRLLATAEALGTTSKAGVDAGFPSLPAVLGVYRISVVTH